MKECKNCFLSPDMCGAKCKKECEEIYENKWFMRVGLFIESCKPAILILLVLIFLALGGMSAYWNFVK